MPIIKLISNYPYINDIMDNNEDEPCLEVDQEIINNLDFSKQYTITNNQLQEIINPPYEPTIIDVQNTKLNTLLIRLNNALSSGYTSPSLNIKVRSTLADIDMFNRALNLMREKGQSDTDSRYIKTYDDVIISITMAQLKQLVIELGTYYDNMWNAYSSTQYKIRLATTIDQINSITIPF